MHVVSSWELLVLDHRSEQDAVERGLGSIHKVERTVGAFWRYITVLGWPYRVLHLA